MDTSRGEESGSDVSDHAGGVRHTDMTDVRDAVEAGVVDLSFKVTTLC